MSNNGSKARIWQYLITHGNQATNSELADYLRGTPGQLSFPQRLREIRQELQAKRGDLTCEQIRIGVYLYKIVFPEPPDTPHEEVIRQNNLAQETRVNLKSIGMQLAYF